MSILTQNENFDLPVDFVELTKKSLPAESLTLFSALNEEAPVSIRLHPYKNAAHDDFSDVVGWCKWGRYLNQRPVFTLDPLFHAGAYYVQEASSMILYNALQQLKLPEHPSILDLCAAPGGKSTLILDFLQNMGYLVSNEVIKSRSAVLTENIIKWGYSNAIVTQNDPADFAVCNEMFDVIIVDAPCSGEGMFRKDKNAISEWSLEHVNFCSARQKRIVDDVASSLKPGGYLIYSTCTFNEEENMQNVVHFSEKFQLESIELPVSAKWGVVSLNKGGVSAYQMIPGKVKGEGFFIAVLRKKEGAVQSHRSNLTFQKLKPLSKQDKSKLSEWFDISVCEDLLMHENGDIYLFAPILREVLPFYLKNLNVKYAGLKTGQYNKNIFIPDHALALSYNVNILKPRYELSIEDALHYLHKSLHAVQDAPLSWILMTYKGLGLGWAKNLGNRINNYLPAHLRILMDLPS